MKVRIATLSENTASFGFIAEWGLSFLITTDDCQILFDTGFSTTAVQNAQALGIDLSTVDKIVLSHGHADHTGGLRDILKRVAKKVEVIAHPDMWTPKYTRLGGREFYIGIPFQREELESLGASFYLTKESMRLSSSMLTTGEIPMSTGYEKIDPEAFVMQKDSLTHDPIADDLAIVIDTEEGLIVVLGCAHRGVINTIYQAQRITGKKAIYAVIGGIHLFRAPSEQVERTIITLKEMKVKKIGVSHCTGFYASCRLAQEFGDDFFLSNAGSCLTLP